MSYTGLMRNTDTTYIHSDPAFAEANPCQIIQEKKDSVEYIPLKSYNPIIPLNNTRHTTGCLIYTILFLIVFAFLRIRGKGLLSLLFQVILKKKKYEIILNDGIIPNLVYYILALVLSFSAIAIGVTYIINQEVDFEYAFYIFGILLFYHIGILCIVRFISWTFNAHYAGEEVIVNLWVYHIWAGFLISPFIIALFFVKIFAIPLLLKIITICLALFYLFKFIRWDEILFVYRVSIFYMILYLCALEVIPVLILYKLLAY